MSAELIIVPVLAPALLGAGAVAGGFVVARQAAVAVDALSKRIAEEIARQRERDRRLREERLALRTVNLERAERRAAAIQTLESLYLDIEDSARIECDAAIRRVRHMLASLGDADAVDAFGRQLDDLETRATSPGGSEDLTARLLRLETSVARAVRGAIEADAAEAPTSSRLAERQAALRERLCDPVVRALPEAWRIAELMRPAVERLAAHLESDDPSAAQHLSLLERQLEEAIEGGLKMQRRRQRAREKLHEDVAVVRGTLVALSEQAPTERIAGEAQTLLRALERALATASSDLLPDVSRLHADAARLRSQAEAELAAQAQKEAAQALLRDALRDLEDEYEICELPEDPSQPSYVIALQKGLGAHYRVRKDGSIRGRLVRIERDGNESDKSASRAEIARCEKEVCRVADRLLGSLDRRGVAVQRERRRGFSHIRLATIRLPDRARDREEDLDGTSNDVPRLLARDE